MKKEKKEKKKTRKGKRISKRWEVTDWELLAPALFPM